VQIKHRTTTMRHGSGPKESPKQIRRATAAKVSPKIPAS